MPAGSNRKKKPPAFRKQNAGDFLSFVFERFFFLTNKTPPGTGGVFISKGNQMARSTLLERRHLVQAYTWHGVPLTTALTRFTLGFQVRLERLWEWET